MAEGRFVVVYHEDLIANFSEVWHNDHSLATWLRLFALADKLWPSPAEMPRGVSPTAVKHLVSLGLVERLPHHQYRVLGLDARRQRAKAVGKNAAGARWNAESNAPSNAEKMLDPMPRTDAGAGPQSASGLSSSSPPAVELGTLRAIPPLSVKDIRGHVSDVSVTEAAPSAASLKLQLLATELTGIPYVMPHTEGGLGGKALNEQVIPHGFDRVETAWRKVAAQVQAAGASRPTLRQLVLGADDVLNPIPQRDEKAEREGDARAAFDRRVARTRSQIADLTGEKA